MRKIAALLAAAFSVFAGLAHAADGADLSISPKRVVFGSADRAATIYVFNRGTEAATYGLSLSDQVMTPDGQIRPVKDASGAPDAAAAVANLKSASSFVSFAPRRVTLQPGQSQTVRMRVLRAPDLAPGEYRSHLTITAVPPEDQGLTAEQAADTSQGQLGVKIVTLFSVAIPVIVRQGDAEVAAAFEGLALQSRDVPDKDGPKRVGVVSMDILRQGKSSLYGDIEIRALKGGKPGEMVGYARGIGVYPEIDRRKIAIPLTRLPAHGEVLQVTFHDDDTRPGAVLATGTLAAP